MNNSQTKFLPKALSIYKKETLPIFHFKDMVLSEIEHSACLGIALKEAGN